MEITQDLIDKAKYQLQQLVFGNRATDRECVLHNWIVRGHLDEDRWIVQLLVLVRTLDAQDRMDPRGSTDAEIIAMSKEIGDAIEACEPGPLADIFQQMGTEPGMLIVTRE